MTIGVGQLRPAKGKDCAKTVNVNNSVTAIFAGGCPERGRAVRAAIS
jgi:hypothetical protein